MLAITLTAQMLSTLTMCEALPSVFTCAEHFILTGTVRSVLPSSPLYRDQSTVHGEQTVQLQCS